MPSLERKKILLIIGAGNMGESLLRSWVENQINDTCLLVLELSPSEWLKSVSQKGLIELNPREITKQIDVCVFAIKPQNLGEVLKENYLRISKKTLIISVVAGKDFSFFQANFQDNIPIIRVMPNTPVAVNQGVSAIVADQYANKKHVEWAKKLFSPLGKVVQLKNEREIDVVTAISGSGPAYVFNFIENLIEMAEELGLSSEVSRKLAIQTVIGAGLLAESTKSTPRRLRENVTSPAGTTEAALEVLMDSKFGWKPIIKKAINAAHIRSQELSGSKKVERESSLNHIEVDDFTKVDIRVGEIVRAEPYPDAKKPAFKLWINFGPELGERKSSAQITNHYLPETLVGRQILAVVNFGPRQIGKFVSEVLVLGVPDKEDSGIILVEPEKKALVGGRMY